MTLAFILFNYFPYGGLQRDFLTIATRCHQLGHQITVFTMKWEGEQAPEWMEVIRIKTSGLRNHRRAARFSAQVTARLQKKHFDKVIGFSKMPGLDIYYAADSCFVTKPQYYFNPLKRLTSRYRRYRQLEKTVFAPNSKTQILLLSKPEKIRYQHVYNTPEERLHLLPPGIDKKFIRPTSYQQLRQTKREKLGLTDNTFMVLTVASHFHTKGVDRTIKAIKALPDQLRQRVKLLVAGSDHPKQYLKLTKPIDDHVAFLGPRDDIEELMFAADLFVHLARHDNTGTVILEALVAGLPSLVTARCGYAPYTIEANAGLVIPYPFHQDEANQALEQALDINQLKLWKESALAYSKAHDLHGLFDQAVSFIAESSTSSPQISKT